MNKKPVIVYGASGYTGRLICEFLREYQIPFIAAGRNRAKIEEAMAKVPGIETADYEIQTVAHNVESLTNFFSGAKVVCNTVGPFSRFGSTVVEACLAAQCHYLDTTGEQAWMMEMRDIYSDSFAEKGLVLAPSTSYMHAVGNIAAEFCLEDSTIDSINAACIPTGVPTVGSTQTVMDMCRNKQHWLENNHLVEIQDPMAHGHEVTVPGFNATIMALPWGGGSLPLWYANDVRVHTATSLTGFTNRPLMRAVMDIAANYNSNIKDLPLEEQEAQLDAIAASITPSMPPRENRNIHRLVDRVYGTGPKSQVCCTILGHSAYIQTGLVQAFIAKTLIGKGPNNVGFQSPCKVVGHRELYGALEGFGFCSMKLETI